MVFRAAGDLLFRHPAFRRVASVLFFLPLPYTLVEYGCTVKQISGTSMQVAPVPSCPPLCLILSFAS
jgi:hypothetical protein